jgi:F-type H+-transporting ATPase subunit delta
MIEGSLSRRYTRALFQLAREAGREDITGQEVERFHAACEGTELQRTLTNPAFPLESRKRILIQVANALRLSVLTIHFLSLVLERDRLTYLAAIVTCYRRLLNQAQGRVEAKVVSAAALEPAMVERLRERLRGISGKEVVLQQAIDAELLGGLLVELEGQIYDGTVRTQLERMKQRVAREY